MVAEHGKKWKTLESSFPGRTEISIKNRYNVLLRQTTRDLKAALNLSSKTKKAKTTVTADTSPPPSPICDDLQYEFDRLDDLTLNSLDDAEWETLDHTEY
jgi:hypothetical protein